MKKYWAIILSALWPGLGHIYLKKPLGFLVFFIWLHLISRFLQTFPLPVYMDPSRISYYITWIGCAIVWLGMMADVYQIQKKEKTIKTSFLLVAPFFLIILVYIFLCLPLRWVNPNPNLSVGSLHTHTVCSDGRGDYETVINLAAKLGYDFIAITDHGFCKDVAEKCEREKRLTCFPGQEIGGKVQVIAVGIRQGINMDNKSLYNTPVKEIVKKIHELGGIAIAPHPMNPEGQSRYSVEELTQSDFDGMECERASLWENNRQYQIVKDFNIHCVYSNDAHEIGMLKTVYSVCDKKIKTLPDLKEAIGGGKCKKFSPADGWISNLPDLLLGF